MLGNFIFFGSLNNQRPCLVNICSNFSQGDYDYLRGMKEQLRVIRFHFLTLKIHLLMWRPRFGCIKKCEQTETVTKLTVLLLYRRTKTSLENQSSNKL
jgi:hypothetical protein